MKLLFLLILLLPIGFVSAQTPVIKEDVGLRAIPVQQTLILIPISTDRPTQSYSTGIIAYGKMNIETGGVYGFDRTNSFENTSIVYNTSTIRLPFLSQSEFRITSDFGSFNQTHITTGESGETNGLSPILLGFKTRLGYITGTSYQSALLVNVGINKLASTSLRTLNPEHEILYLGSLRAGRRGSVGFNVGTAWDGFSPNVYGKYSAFYSHIIKGRYHLFGELYGNWPQAQGADLSISVGGYWQITSEWQFDISGGYGLSERSTDWFVSAGVSRRLRFNIWKRS